MTNTQVQKNTTEVNGVLTESVLVEPWITEASTLAMELNKYIFKVSPDAAKGQIKRAIEELYKVKVLAVNTVKIPRKFRNYGRTPGWKSGFKKAVVTLKEGDKIELFQGV
jgi:large subunit ribosomal protein L23